MKEIGALDGRGLTGAVACGTRLESEVLNGCRLFCARLL